MRIIIIFYLRRTLLKKNLVKIKAYTLASLKRGQKGIIESVDTSDPQVQRLMVLGLVEGAEIEHVSSAIGGDPMEFRLFGCGISLRQEHARFFKVSPVVAGG
jgi:ferrous iron transport protein A|tara:strand:+ start:9740 stop:10045 length:306 start_codon:yes stop_codon:yes gene_type:complete